MRIIEIYEQVEKITFKKMKGDLLYTKLLVETQNKNVRSAIKYLSSNYRDYGAEIDFVAVTENRQVVGVAGVQYSPYDENELWLKMISVDADYQHRGIGQTLAEMVFKFAKGEGANVRGSRYSALGEKHLRARLENLAKKYDVPFKHGDDDTKFEEK